MKKILSLCTLMAALSSPIVAQDDNMRRTDEADYTVIEFIVGGGNLDITEFDEMNEMIAGDFKTGEHQLLGKKINFVGLQKPSKEQLDMLEEQGLGGTRIFEAVCQSPETFAELREFGQYMQTQITSADDITPEIVNQLLVYYYNSIKQAPYADASFDFNDVNSIAAAFVDLKERYPAKQYIFMANGHGEGWNTSDCIDYVDPVFGGDEEEEPEAGKRRAMIFDDNMFNQGMGLDQLVAAAQLAGIHFQLIFDDLCLMSTWENLYGYAQIADYAMTSVEMTTGAELYPFIQHLANAAGDGQKLFDEMSDYIQNNEYHAFTDYSLFTNMYPTLEEALDAMFSGGEEDPEMASASDDEEDEEEFDPRVLSDYQDMGIYDLTKLGTVSPILKNIQAWYCQNYSAQQSVIDAAILNATRNYGSKKIEEEVIADKLDLVVETLSKYGMEQEARELANSTMFQHFQLTFADVVYQTLAMGKNEGTDVSELAALYEQYIAALKDMSSAKCSFAPYDEPDYVYRTCSPSVIMYQLDPEKCPNLKDDNYSEMFLWGAASFYLEASAEAYKASLFDQDVKWSEFLSMLDVRVTAAKTHSRQWHLTFDAEDVPTAIQQIGQSSATVSYDLFGRQLSNDTKGLSISGGKVVVK